MPPSHFPSPVPGVKQKCSDWAAGASRDTSGLGCGDRALGLWSRVWVPAVISDWLFCPGRFLRSFFEVDSSDWSQWEITGCVAIKLMGLTGVVTFRTNKRQSDQTDMHNHNHKCWCDNWHLQYSTCRNKHNLCAQKQMNKYSQQIYSVFD